MLKQRLQLIVEKALVEEKATNALREEIKKNLGPTVITDVRLEQLAEAVNDRLEVLERTGRRNAVSFKTSTIARFADHKHPEVRKMAARLLPVRFLTRYVSDPDAGVRFEAAKRANTNFVREMIKRNPQDDGLRSIYREKLQEAGIKDPNAKKPDEDHLSLYDEEPLGDLAKLAVTPELGDFWYKQRAKHLLSHYGDNIEFNWEELACKNLVNHTKATSGVEIDYDKLYKAVKDAIKDKEDLTLERDTLKETLEWLKQGKLAETSVFEIQEEVNDPINELSKNLSDTAYVIIAKKVFNVKESTLPPAIKKFRIGEGLRTETRVPMKATLPHVGTIRAIDERALDEFVNRWNKLQALAGEPIKISWTQDPTSISSIGFKLVLR